MSHNPGGAQDLISTDQLMVRKLGSTSLMVFRFASYYARMKEEMIAVVKPENVTFCLLIKLIKIYDNGTLIQWQVQKDGH